MKNNCVFCAIAAGEIPAFKIYEDERILSYLDINPFSRGHVLVITKNHYADLIEIPDSELANLSLAVKKIAAHVQSKLNCDGFNILQNNGEAAGQTVRHIHFHIVPRMNGQPISFENRPGDMQLLKTLAEELKL